MYKCTCLDVEGQRMLSRTDYYIGQRLPVTTKYGEHLDSGSQHGELEGKVEIQKISNMNYKRLNQRC
jgi:hypothetical protein